MYHSQHASTAKPDGESRMIRNINEPTNGRLYGEESFARRERGYIICCRCEQFSKSNNGHSSKMVILDISIWISCTYCFSGSNSYSDYLFWYPYSCQEMVYIFWYFLILKVINLLITLSYQDCFIKIAWYYNVRASINETR